MPDLAIRPATSDDTRAIFDTLMGMFEESPMCDLDAWQAASEIGRVCIHEAAWVVYDDGTMAATMGLAEARMWYSPDPILVTRWLYARPEYRSNSEIWRMMEAEAQALADATGMVALLDVFNPAKAGKRVGVASRAFRVEPRGVRLRVEPVKEAA